MDKLDKYREIIKNIINRNVELFNSDKDKDVREFAIFDDQHAQYQWLSLGWKNNQRNFYVILHLRIYQGKIWIEEDSTEYGIARELLEKGVPREDIVLAFHSPEMRELTEFAVA